MALPKKGDRIVIYRQMIGADPAKRTPSFIRTVHNMRAGQVYLDNGKLTLPWSADPKDIAAAEAYLAEQKREREEQEAAEQAKWADPIFKASSNLSYVEQGQWAKLSLERLQRIEAWLAEVT
ncbi:MAG TPA: hypothetical protein VF595_12575 [Tepidisphaeraceae bacterium]|jgi:hypothetical protein